jgi:hypothetical protein
MIKTPSPCVTGQERFAECKEAIELAFLELIDAATAVGWEAEEAATALVAVSDDFIRAWLAAGD